MLQRSGYPNASIKLYYDDNAWIENKYTELGATFVSMTLRDGLMNGANEGLLRIIDFGDMQTRLTGNEIIEVSLQTANTDIVYRRIYAIKHFAVAIDEKGDSIITFQLISHYKTNLKFTRVFSNNAADSLTEMLNYLYKDRPLLMPKLTPINIRVPKTNWCQGIVEYMQFIRDHGASVDKEGIPLVWEDFYGIHLSDLPTITEAEPRKYIVTEPRLIGNLSNIVDPIAYDFEWLTKANPYLKNPYLNNSFYAHSMLDKMAIRTIVGDGDNSIFISRSGGYADQVHRDGHEEYNRMLTIAQYDSYSRVKIHGDFSVVPGMKLHFYDIKNQFPGDFYVDEIIHEVSREMSITNIYMFSANGQIIEAGNNEETEA